MEVLSLRPEHVLWWDKLIKFISFEVSKCERGFFQTRLLWCAFFAPFRPCRGCIQLGGEPLPSDQATGE
jgi:hypothetical protein